MPMGLPFCILWFISIIIKFYYLKSHQRLWTWLRFFPTDELLLRYNGPNEVLMKSTYFVAYQCNSDMELNVGINYCQQVSDNLPLKEHTKWLHSSKRLPCDHHIFLPVENNNDQTINQSSHQAIKCCNIYNAPAFNTCNWYLKWIIRF